MTFLFSLPPCLFLSTSSNSIEWQWQYPGSQKTEGLQSTATLGTTVVSLPWMGEDRRLLCWRSKLVAQLLPRRPIASSLASVLLRELHGAKAYSPRVPNSFSAGMRAVESTDSQVLGQWCDNSILSVIISSGCEGAGFLSDPVWWKNDTLSLLLVPGQMYSLSRMEGLKKEPTQIKRMEKKKKPNAREVQKEKFLSWSKRKYSAMQH